MVTPNRDFWSGKRVFLTGHTGFKGSWLTLWLREMGAQVAGYALEPPSTPSLFEKARAAEGIEHTIADIRDGDRLTAALTAFAPDIVIHMAAQSLVRLSYDDPVGTYGTNVMGTVNLFEAARAADSVRVIVNITSDKCYENREWVWGYRESDAMGGYDPYSSSKGCAELVAGAYARSFFRPGAGGPVLASGRAGNVIGGGDWAKDRLVPDIMRAWAAGEAVQIRCPDAVRPWQHVLEPLRGYLILAERLWDDGAGFEGGWNFGPHAGDVQPVRGVLGLLQNELGDGLRWDDRSGGNAPHEAGLLRLDISKAEHVLGWRPAWGLEQALRATAQWYRADKESQDMRAVTLQQISDYSALAGAAA